MGPRACGRQVLPCTVCARADEGAACGGRAVAMRLSGTRSAALAVGEWLYPRSGRLPSTRLSIQHGESVTGPARCNARDGKEVRQETVAP
jgi:hypothetical protein